MAKVDRRLIPPEVTTESPFEEGRPESLLSTTVRVPVEVLTAWQIDWEAYRAEFSRRHGDKPVHLDSWLVWEDGWRCDAYDPGGTELPPPEDKQELRSLLLVYYQKRRAVQTGFFRTLRSRIETIESIQSHKSLPLKMEYVRWDRDVGEDGFETISPSLVREGINLKGVRKALVDLRSDLQYCEQKIAELTEEQR